MARLGVNEVQADAILNLRLRALRRLERMGIETEHEALCLKRLELEALIAEDAKRWRAIADGIKDIRKRFSIDDGNGRGARKWARRPSSHPSPPSSWWRPSPSPWCAPPRVGSAR